MTTEYQRKPETFEKELYERDLVKNITERVKKEVTERVEQK